jgi:hypothetical protein
MSADKPQTAYKAISPQVDLAAMERIVLDFWEDQSIFHQSLLAREGAPAWTFYEGPPTANGAPGTHHIEARVFKDVFPRFHTMKGKYVVRKAGWDCMRHYEILAAGIPTKPLTKPRTKPRTKPLLCSCAAGARQRPKPSFVRVVPRERRVQRPRCAAGKCGAYVDVC